MMIPGTMNDMLYDRVGRLAVEAILVEVSVTPKPGLVDRNNSGAHKDMDFFTFMKSAASLHSILFIKPIIISPVKSIRANISIRPIVHMITFQR